MRAHARTRQQQGIALAAVVREAQYLRSELWAIFRPAPPPSLTTTDLLRLEEALSATFDGVIVESVEAYTASTVGPDERPAGA